MRSAIKTMLAGFAACAPLAPAAAYTLTGTIQGNTRNMTAVRLQKPPGNGFLKLTISAPPANVGIPYDVSFCFSLASLPPSAPCALTSQGGFLVLPGQPATVLVLAAAYLNHVVWLGTGLRASVPYTIDVDYLP